MSSAVTREKLYEEVWAEPMTTVAKRYGVSSNYLGRICERLIIPRPPRGYWQQLAAGRTPSVPPLPEPDPGDEVAWHRHVEPYALHPPAPVFTPVATRTSRREERPKTHPILVAVREEFEDSRPKRFCDDGYLKPKTHALPDIQVSKDSLDAALKIANKLYLALEDQGHWVRLAPQAIRYHRRSIDHREGAKERYDPYDNRTWHPNPLTLVFVGGVAIGLTLFEISEEVDAIYEDGRWIHAPARVVQRVKRAQQPWQRVHRHHLPNGRLALYVYSPYGGADWSKCWRETKAGQLPTLFEEIGLELERAAPQIVRLYAEAQRRQEEQERKWQAERRAMLKREAARRRAEVEQKRREYIVAEMGNWRMARDIRDYVSAVHELAKEAEVRVTEGGPIDVKLKWALAHADRIDPLSRIRKAIAMAKAEHSPRGDAPTPPESENDAEESEEPWPGDPEPVGDGDTSYYDDDDEAEDA